ncbi:MAG: hypothetical protein ACTHJG_01390 [Rhodanobacteraceae bacterium]
MTARTVCRCTPPNLPPAPRDSSTIAGELANAAEHLDAFAHRMFALGDGVGEHETAELDALALGIGRAACELRARLSAQGGDHA